MSDDTISRQAAIGALVKRTNLTWEHLKIIYPMLDVLEELPSAERHGRWKTLKGYSNVLLCSECDTPYEKKEFAITPNYCYNCGARMINENE